MIRISTPLLLALFLACRCSGQTLTQNSEAKVLDSTDYRLPPAAVSAGIDGKLPIGLTINADGRASDIRVYGGPMWPCGSSAPNSLIEEIRKDVKQHILGMKFAPEIKGGKPNSVSAEITFMLSERMRGAANMPGRLFRPNLAEPGLVDVGPIERRADSLAKPSKLVQSRGVVILQLLVDEKGSVTSAGLFKGSPALATAARDAACESKFKPATVSGRAVSMTGILTYFFK